MKEISSFTLKWYFAVPNSRLFIFRIKTEHEKTEKKRTKKNRKHKTYVRVNIFILRSTNSC